MCRQGLFFVLVSVFLISPGFGQRQAAKRLTALDRYVKAPDDSYEWNLVHNQSQPGVTTYLIDLTSQTWRKPGEVDRTEWKHWLTIVRPQQAKVGKALLFIGGGKNGGAPPKSVDPMLARVAQATGSVVAELGMIPNQPLVFHGDGVSRSEDDLVAYTWDQYLKTGDELWPARLPMVKAVVRAMDTIQAVFEQKGEGLRINEFVVAGGSKRGWTTWMTAAVDPRVVAIVPIVIDVLNVEVSMEHHYAAYGFWAPAVGDYVHHHIPQRRKTARYDELLQLVDPYAYRDRFTIPKCIINSAGDQFFVPDSSQFYFDDLPGEKHLCYVPNSDHSLNGSDALDTLIAFYHAILNGVARPALSWDFDGAESVAARATSQPKTVRLWQATNPDARDFRLDTIGKAYHSREIDADSGGGYRATVSAPEQGWTAYFMQFEFETGAPTPLRLTTPVRIVPDTLPFADREAPIDE